MRRLYAILLLLFVTNTSFSEQTDTLVVGDKRTEVYLPLLENKRVGLVCNHTSVVDNVHLADTLLSCGVNIATIFTPEHGFKGNEQAGKLINSTIYYKDTIKVISLYGKNKKPTPEMMSDIDIIVFDLQDVGCRFYTYISTLEYVMQSCIETQKPLIVLDRPNPNNFVAGPVLQDDCRSFVGMQNIPICYGLTIGEYAMMVSDELSKVTLSDDKTNIHGYDLTVIKMLSYNRDSVYEFAIYPSPNLQSMQSVRNYPTLCLFEGTPVSVGRGTNRPFEIIGFPAYEAQSSSQATESVSFIPRSVKGVAENPPFKDIPCKGTVVRIDTNEIMLEYVTEMYKQYPRKDGFFTRMFDLLAGNKTLKNQIIDGSNAEQIRKSWSADLERYKQKRTKYLIY